MNSLWNDFRFSLRKLQKSPGFTFIIICILGLGIGMTTVIFSVMNAILLRSLPYHDADKIVMVWESKQSENNKSSVSWAKLVDWRKQQSVFDSIAGTNWSNKFSLTGEDRPEVIPGLSVSPAYFEVFKLQPLQGRLLYSDDAKPGQPSVAVITEELWNRKFNRDPEIAGKTVQLSMKEYTIVGVLPSGFKQKNGAQIFIPLVEDGILIKERTNHSYQVFARLKPNVTVAQAKAEMNVIARQLEKEHPDTDENWRVNVVPLHKEVVGELQSALCLLLGAVVLLLLIACSNVANLQFVRALSRRKETAVRAAIGAGRWQVIRQLLIESVILSLTGGALGVMLTYWSLDLLLVYASSMLPNIITIAVDWRVLGFVLFVSILTGIAFGLFPAMDVSRFDLAGTLKEGERGTSQSFRRNRTRSAFIIAQTSLALVLLVGAGLMLQSLIQLSQINPGFKTSNLITVSISPPNTKYGTGKTRHNFFNQIIAQLYTVPGIESVGGNSFIPMTGHSGRYTKVIGRPELPENDRAPQYRLITPDYFKTMSIPIKQGRSFTNQDTIDSNLVVMINEEFANRVFPNENPVGQYLGIEDDWNDENNNNLPREIVGVVGNIRQYSLIQEPRPEIYVPHSQCKWDYDLSLLIHTQVNPYSLIPEVRNAIWNIDKDQAVGNFTTMEQIVDKTIMPQKLNASLFSIFAFAALILAALGIYGVISYSISQTTHEIGIRMALGAQKRDVIRMVIKQGMILVVFGLAIGLFCTFVFTRFLSSQLYGITATDPLVISTVTLLLALVALLACYIPARRAANVDPMTALRCE